MALRCTPSTSSMPVLGAMLTQLPDAHLVRACWGRRGTCITRVHDTPQTRECSQAESDMRLLCWAETLRSCCQAGVLLSCGLPAPERGVQRLHFTQLHAPIPAVPAL